MASYLFLSPEWIEAARDLRAEYHDRLPAPPVQTRINVLVTGVAHNDDPVMKGHIDTTNGQPIIEHGHLDSPDLTITVDYETARAAFVTRDVETLMASFIGGKILVEGDVSVLMALQATPAPENAEELAEMYARLEALTA